jgi:hypothetical protein
MLVARIAQYPLRLTGEKLRIITWYHASKQLFLSRLQFARTNNSSLFCIKIAALLQTSFEDGRLPDEELIVFTLSHVKCRRSSGNWQCLSFFRAWSPPPPPPPLDLSLSPRWEAVNHCHCSVVYACETKTANERVWKVYAWCATFLFVIWKVAYFLGLLRRQSSQNTRETRSKSFAEKRYTSLFAAGAHQYEEHDHQYSNLLLTSEDDEHIGGVTFKNIAFWALLNGSKALNCRIFSIICYISSYISLHIEVLIIEKSL